MSPDRTVPGADPGRLAAAWRDEAHVAANRAAYAREDGGGRSASWATA